MCKDMAHPLAEFRNIHLVISGRRELTLADLFKKPPESAVSAYVYEDLRRPVGDASIKDSEAIKAEVSAVSRNISRWNVEPSGLRVDFDYYEVGPRPAGQPSVKLPMALLRPVLSDFAIRQIVSAKLFCLPYEPAAVKLNGTLMTHQGLRNWWGVKLDEPICTIPVDSLESYHNVQELQLLMGEGDFDRYAPLIGRKVSVSGKLEAQSTGYHQTKVMIGVAGMEVRENKPVLPVGPPSEPPAKLLDVQSYFASVTVERTPARVIKKAWVNDPSHLLPHSEFYIDHMFNGPMDVLWVTCRDGYTTTGPTSSTDAHPFRMSPDDPTDRFWGISVNDTQSSEIAVGCQKVPATKAGATKRLNADEIQKLTKERRYESDLVSSVDAILGARSIPESVEIYCRFIVDQTEVLLGSEGSNPEKDIQNFIHHGNIGRCKAMILTGQEKMLDPGQLSKRASEARKRIAEIDQELARRK